MKFKSLTALMAAAMIAGSFPPPSHAETAQARIVNTVNFRELPSTSGQRIRYLQSGETVEILEQVNNYWYKVKDHNNQIGYVSTSDKYIQTLSTVPQTGPTHAEPASTDSSTATVVSSVSFRTSPSTSSDRIRYLKTGESITILEKVNAYWYKAQDSSGTVGYVSSLSQYVEFNGQPSGGSPSSGSPSSGTGGATQSSAPADSGNQSSTGSNQTRSEKIQKVIDTAKKYLGTPYEFASNRNNNDTFDCSDLTRTAYREGIGVWLPYDSRQQGDFVKKRGNIVTDWHQLQPGDLLFFMSYKGYKASDYAGIDKLSQRITHVAMYIGNGQIIQTYSNKSGGVRIDKLEGSTWALRFMYGGSVID
ncbi:C40 family peptidase [Ferviditalea candida]|uniref:SH3 domain-containing C40 family peptidase n=1 Tax=Ferviditalea candida TaxID=3108399 RepID=A0ABU5ZKU9_9BACL|nr:SH3 domain-containing C40 family peptidase [Paenibacillaceae bacterium T2]